MNETAIRLGIFIVFILLFGLIEARLPRRPIHSLRRVRWVKNYAFVVSGSLFMHIALPITVTGAALLADKHGFGLFNWVTIPVFWQVVICLILFDLVIYLQHLTFHRIAIFWRIHQIHHIDEAIDSSTAIRFHPVEFFCSGLIKIMVVFLLGSPWIAVILFEILLSSMAIFNHANLKLPEKLDSLLRHIVVTPDMHRIHHSIYPDEHHKNFGFNLSIWDKLFKTYQISPRDPHETMQIGQIAFPDSTRNTFWRMLITPFKRR